MAEEMGTPMEEKQGGSKAPLIIVIVLVGLCILSLICGGLIWALWTYGDQIFGLAALAFT